MAATRLSRSLLLPALSAAVLACAAPPLSFIPVAFVGLVPLFVWIDRPLPAREMVRGAAAFGIPYILSQGWSIYSLARFTPIGALIATGAVLMLVSTWLVFPIVLNLLQHTRPLPLPLVAPLLWVVTEHARSFGDLAIPYIMLGHFLAPSPRLIQTADLVGVYGLSAWIVAVNALIAWGLCRWRNPRLLRIAVAALAGALAFPLGYGAVRWNAIDRQIAAAPKVPVAVIQPNVAQELKWDPGAIPGVFERVNRLIARAEEGSPRLVVGPESCLPVFSNAAATRLPDTVLPGRAPLLLGIIAGIGEGVERNWKGGRITVYERHHNSAFLADAERRILGRYDKRALVPMGERIPFGAVLRPLALMIEGRFGEFEPGRDDQLLDIPGPGPAARAGMLICYEAVFPRLVAATRADGADFLINITNDAWFGRTSFAWLFAQVCALRAVENRCAVVRAANTGVSVFYDPLGRAFDATPVGQEAVIRGEVPLLRGATFYDRAGDLVVWLSYAGTVALLLVAWVAHRRKT